MSFYWTIVSWMNEILIHIALFILIVVNTVDENNHGSADGEPLLSGRHNPMAPSIPPDHDSADGGPLLSGRQNPMAPSIPPQAPSVPPPADATLQEVETVRPPSTSQASIISDDPSADANPQGTNPNGAVKTVTKRKNADDDIVDIIDITIPGFKPINYKEDSNGSYFNESYLKNSGRGLLGVCGGTCGRRAWELGVGGRNPVHLQLKDAKDGPEFVCHQCFTIACSTLIRNEPASSSKSISALVAIETESETRAPVVVDNIFVLCL